MYNNKDKKFHCNRCDKVVSIGEKCWTKWNFPPKIMTTQMLPIKELEFQNAPILCLDCADKMMSEKF